MSEDEPGAVPEQREYSFEEGAQEIIARIEQLLQTQTGVVIAISGSSNNVGKTFLSGAIGQCLNAKGIMTVMQTDLSNMDQSIHLPYFMNGDPAKGRVLILAAEDFLYGDVSSTNMDHFRQSQDERIKEKAIAAPDKPRI